MSSSVTSYATVLFTIVPDETVVQTAEKMLRSCPLLGETLSNPLIAEAEKFSCIEKIFPSALHTFCKLVCRNGQTDQLLEIFSEYRALVRQNCGIAHAILEYVTPLTEAQLAAMRKKICAETGKSEVQLELRKNPALLGGFVLQIGDRTYDRSQRRAIQEMRKSLIRR